MKNSDPILDAKGQRYYQQHDDQKSIRFLYHLITVVVIGGFSIGIIAEYVQEYQCDINLLVQNTELVKLHIYIFMLIHGGLSFFYFKKQKNYQFWWKPLGCFVFFIPFIYLGLKYESLAKILSIYEVISIVLLSFIFSLFFLIITVYLKKEDAIS